MKGPVLDKDRQQAPAPADWYAALAQIASDCADLPASEEARLLSALVQHLRQAPLAATLQFGDLPQEDGFGELLAAGAADTAALRLIGGEAGYMVSRGPGGLHFASVVLAGQSEECSAGGDSMALALAGAFALALARTAEFAPGAFDPALRPALRLN